MLTRSVDERGIGLIDRSIIRLVTRLVRVVRLVLGPVLWYFVRNVCWTTDIWVSMEDVWPVLRPLTRK